VEYDEDVCLMGCGLVVNLSSVVSGPPRIDDDVMLFPNFASRGLVEIDVDVGCCCAWVANLEGGEPPGVVAAFNFSSVARIRASSCSSSEVCEDISLFLQTRVYYQYLAVEDVLFAGGAYFSETTASRSSRLLSSLNISSKARANDLAIVLFQRISLLSQDSWHDCSS
jgi:hypothetical protein